MFVDTAQPYETTHLIRTIGDLSVQSHREMSRILHLNDTDLQVMMYLMENGPKSIGEISEHFQISHPLATISANRIQAVGHGHRSRDTHDHRRVLIEPDAGSIATAMGHLMPMIQQTEDYFQSLSEDDKEVVSTFLETVVAIMENSINTLQSTPAEPVDE